MKNRLLLLSFAMLLLSGNSYAQNSILAGIITNESGKAIPGATIVLSMPGMQSVEIQSDKDGLYSSQLLPIGQYNVAISVKGRKMPANNLVLDAASGSKKFYTMKVNEGKVSMITVNNDPAVLVKLRRIEKDDHNTIDAPMSTSFTPDGGSPQRIHIRAKNDSVGGNNGSSHKAIQKK